MRTRITGILLIIVGIGVFVMGGIVTALSQGAVLAEWKVASSAVTLDKCSGVVVPPVGVESPLPPALQWLVDPNPRVSLEVQGSSSWGLASEDSIPELLLGVRYCTLAGPPWSVTVIDAGDGELSESDIAQARWGSAKGNAELALPQEPAWVIALSTGDGVAFQWFITHQWSQQSLVVGVFVLVAGLVLSIVGVLVIVRRSRVQVHDD